MQSCRVQSEGVKNESKGLQETGFPARTIEDSVSHLGIGTILHVWGLILQCMQWTHYVFTAGHPLVCFHALL